MAKIPERLRWAVDGLDLRRGSRVLEIGCGRGHAALLVCERLEALGPGSVTAVDRSAPAVAATEHRLAAHVETGRARVVRATLADLQPVDIAGASADAILAVNVNVFWTAPAAPELAAIERLLAPAGAVHVVYEPPSADAAARVAGTVGSLFEDAGYAVSGAEDRTATGGALVRLVARRR